MAGQILKNKQGVKIGEIKEQSGRLCIYDKQGVKQGEFDPKTNVTKDRRGVKVGSGNLLVTLLPL